MSDRQCTHQWRTCPVHSVPVGLPSFPTVVECVYGDIPTKDGRPHREHAVEVATELRAALDGGER
jgi:hypothetical protein